MIPQGPCGHSKVLSDRWDSRTRTTACAMVFRPAFSFHPARTHPWRNGSVLTQDRDDLSCMVPPLLTNGVIGRHKVMDTLRVYPSCRTLHSDFPPVMSSLRTISRYGMLRAFALPCAFGTDTFLISQMCAHLCVSFDAISSHGRGADVQFLRIRIRSLVCDRPPMFWDCSLVMSDRHIALASRVRCYLRLCASVHRQLR